MNENIKDGIETVLDGIKCVLIGLMVYKINYFNTLFYNYFHAPIPAIASILKVFEPAGLISISGILLPLFI